MARSAAAERKTYVSDQPVYVDEAYIKAGVPFSTDAPKGATWTELTTKESKAAKAAAEAPADGADD